jgi:hypothetical protein
MSDTNSSKESIINPPHLIQIGRNELDPYSRTNVIETRIFKPIFDEISKLECGADVRFEIEVDFPPFKTSDYGTYPDALTANRIRRCEYDLQIYLESRGLIASPVNSYGYFNDIESDYIICLFEGETPKNSYTRDQGKGTFSYQKFATVITIKRLTAEEKLEYKSKAPITERLISKPSRFLKEVMKARSEK